MHYSWCILRKLTFLLGYILVIFCSWIASMENTESLSLILVYQQIIYLCYMAICCLIEYLSSLLYHQNGEKTQ